MRNRNQLARPVLGRSQSVVVVVIKRCTRSHKNQKKLPKDAKNTGYTVFVSCHFISAAFCSDTFVDALTLVFYFFGQIPN